jgi:hypothetical protein
LVVHGGEYAIHVHGFSSTMPHGGIATVPPW